MNREESKIQSECFIWYNNNFCLKFHNPRGMMFSVPNELGGRNKVGTALARSTGLMAGVSDAILILPNSKIIFIEFKTAKGRQTEKQKEFEERVKKHGYEYFIIRSLDEFKKLILYLQL